MPDDIRTGSCLCGAVHYTVNASTDDVTACHCTQCRKQSGHFVASVYAAWSDVSIDGSDNIRWYASSDFAKRGFCSTCGSGLFWVSPEFGAAICAGSLDEPTGARLTNHIFVADKGDYYQIADGLPQYDAYPPEVEQPEKGDD